MGVDSIISFDNVIILFLVGLYISFMVMSVLNIVTKKQYSTKFRTLFFRILSVMILLVPIVVGAINLIKYYRKLFFLLVNLEVTGIIMVLSLYYLFKTTKKIFDLKDIMPIIICLIFITILLIVYNKNGEFARMGTIGDFKSATMLYYMSFLLIPIQLVNVYNLCNLKLKNIKF